MSIASAMADIVRRHLPEKCRVLQVHMQAGPLRGIDADTMEMAWRATVSGTDLEGSTLTLNISPWQLKCPVCGRQWEAPQFNTACECGCEAPHFSQSNELLLTAIDVDDEEES